LTTALTHLRDSVVVAHTTALTYKGKPVDAKAIGKELGVRYVLEGSVQPTSKQVRVNAQLVDAESGTHLWADQFDATHADQLQTQDDIVARLTRAMHLELPEAEITRVKRASAAKPNAEDLALQCQVAFLKNENVFLTAVPEDERVPEDEFMAFVAEDAPAILGALLTGLSVGLKRYPGLKLGSLPRMAAFAKWGAACETAFWEEGTFLKAYAANSASASEDVLEADHVVTLFRSFMTNKSEWKGTMTQLLAALVDIVKAPVREAEAKLKKAKDNSYRNYTTAEQVHWAGVLKEEREKARETLGKGWPSNPRALSARLKKVGPQLRRAAVAITWPTAHLSARIVTVANLQHTPQDNENFASSVSSASSAAENKAKTEDAERNSKGQRTQGQRPPHDGAEDAKNAEDVRGRKPFSSSSYDNQLEDNDNNQFSEAQDVEDAKFADPLGGAELEEDDVLFSQFINDGGEDQ
jgi:hypothetical protein